MRSIRKVTHILALAMLVCAGFVGQAEALPILNISPFSQDASVGDTVTVDIFVSGLGVDEEVGGVSLLLSFNEAVLSGLSFVADPDAKMGFAACGAPCDFSLGFDGGTGSPLDLFFVADASLDATALKNLQGSAFRLATVSFTAIADGFSLLALSTEGSFLSDADGLELGASAINGNVCVGGNCGTTEVPEPATMTLVALGLAGAAARRRRASSPRA